MQEFLFKYVEESDTFCAISYRGDEPHVTVPPLHWGKPVTILFDDLFKGHSELLSVSIPDTVTEIGGFVFDGCLALRHVDLPAALESLWQYAFARCGVEELRLPDGVTQIIPFTFLDCKQLRQVVCGPNMRKVYAHAFKGCDRLTDLRCPPLADISPDCRQ